jgi:hypothetical protein
MGKDIMFGIMAILIIIGWTTKSMRQESGVLVEVVTLKDGSNCAIVNRNEVKCDPPKKKADDEASEK